MFSTLLTAALFIAPAIQGALADFAISSPDLVQCKSAAISWEPTNPPYNLIVVSAANPCGDALVEVGDFSKTFINWIAAIASGTTVQLSLVDANDNEAWSKNITVGASSDSSCLSAALVNPSAGSSSAGASVVSTPASASTPAGAASASNSDPTVVPIGAANAGTLGDSANASAAFTVRQVSMPLFTISGLVAAFVLSL